MDNKVKILVAFSIVCAFIVIIYSIGMRQDFNRTKNQVNYASNKYNMNITSPAFQNNQVMPAKFSCDGEGTNPPFQITDVPTGTLSLVLIVEDPDAPMGTYVHWLVWNITPNTSAILENSVPKGAIEGTTSAGKPGFAPPCPPSGTHKYFFKLYALSSVISLASSANFIDLENEIKDKIIDRAELMGRYNRNDK